MKNYVLVYYNEGGVGDTPAETVKASWGAWFGKLGDKLVDAGYSIVKAGSLDEATELAKDCPVVGLPGGAVRVYETLPM